MAFKQQKNSGSKIKNNLPLIVGGIVVGVFLVVACVFTLVGKGSSGSNEQAQEIEQQQAQDEQADDVQSDEVADDTEVTLTTAQKAAQMSDTQTSKEVWELLLNSRWTNKDSGATISFASNKKQYNEENIANEQNVKKTFVLCKVDKTSDTGATNTTQKETSTSKSYTLTCMGSDDKVFDIDAVVVGSKTNNDESIQSVVLTSDNFNVAKTYTRVSTANEVTVSGINTEQLKKFNVDVDKVSEKVKEYCYQHLPSVTEVNFSQSSVSTYMWQNLVSISCMYHLSSNTANSGSQLYIFDNLDTSEMWVSSKSLSSTTSSSSNGLSTGSSSSSNSSSK